MQKRLLGPIVKWIENQIEMELHLITLTQEHTDGHDNTKESHATWNQETNELFFGISKIL